MREMFICILANIRIFAYIVKQDPTPDPGTGQKGKYQTTIDKAVMAFAGAMVLVSITLTWLVSPWWFLLTAFVGVNLLQASVTGFCPAAIAFRWLGLKSGAAFG